MRPATWYHNAMRVIALRTLREFWTPHADAETALHTWYSDARRANWKSSQEIKAIYPHASIINSSRVVFNIRGNRYRLVAAINYEFETVYIRFVGTHAEYDQIDAATI